MKDKSGLFPWICAAVGLGAACLLVGGLRLHLIWGVLALALCTIVPITGREFFLYRKEAPRREELMASLRRALAEDGVAELLRSLPEKELPLFLEAADKLYREGERSLPPALGRAQRALTEENHPNAAGLRAAQKRREKAGIATFSF